MVLLQFFSRFIKEFMKIARPLANSTRKSEVIHKWDIKCKKSVESLKRAITRAPNLVATDWKYTFRGHIDASSTAFGDTWAHLDNCGKDRVIAFFSKKLIPAEQNYITNNRELLGLIYLLQRFRCYREGSRFEIFTDNQVLRSFLTKLNSIKREARW